jgi:hypothetical protein
VNNPMTDSALRGDAEDRGLFNGIDRGIRAEIRQGWRESIRAALDDLALAQRGTERK